MIFTRYLYYKPFVVGSLFISIAENNIEESLFWGYELYYSGFVNELLEYIIYIIENPSNKYNSLTKKYITKKHDEFNSMGITDARDCIIGTMIRNLTHCKTNTTIKKIRIVYLDKDIIKYRIPIPAIKSRAFLSINCIYSVRPISQYNIDGCSLVIPKQFIETNYNYNEILEIWRTRWEYYSAKSPFWMNIIELNSGSLNHHDKTVEFKNWEDEERFYEKYGYEPDEQSMELCIKCLGNGT